MENVKPAFQAELVKGNFRRTIMSIEENVREVTGSTGITRKIVSRKLKPVVEEFTEAYDIYFPQGHSIRVRADDRAQLERIGVFGPPPLVDMETGEVIGQDKSMSPKQIVMAKTRSRQTGGIETAMGA